MKNIETSSSDAPAKEEKGVVEQACRKNSEGCGHDCSNGDGKASAWDLDAAVADAGRSSGGCFGGERIEWKSNKTKKYEPCGSGRCDGEKGGDGDGRNRMLYCLTRDQQIEGRR